MLFLACAIDTRSGHTWKAFARHKERTARGLCIRAAQMTYDCEACKLLKSAQRNRFYISHVEWVEFCVFNAPNCPYRIWIFAAAKKKLRKKIWKMQCGCFLSFRVLCFQVCVCVHCAFVSRNGAQRLWNRKTSLAHTFESVWASNLVFPTLRNRRRWIGRELLFRFHHRYWVAACAVGAFIRNSDIYRQTKSKADATLWFLLKEKMLYTIAFVALFTLLRSDEWMARIPLKLLLAFFSSLPRHFSSAALFVFVASFSTFAFLFIFRIFFLLIRDTGGSSSKRFYRTQTNDEQQLFAFKINQLTYVRIVFVLARIHVHVRHTSELFFYCSAQWCILCMSFLSWVSDLSLGPPVLRVSR